MMFRSPCPTLADDGPDADIGEIVEANHRIANNLGTIAGLVRSQIREIAKQNRLFTGSEVVGLMEDVSRRIESVGVFHRLLASSQRNTSVDLNIYLQQVAHLALESMSDPDDIAFEGLFGEFLEISADRALPLGFLVGELVTNAVK